MKLNDSVTQDKIAAVNNWVTYEAISYGKYEPFDENAYRFLTEKIANKLGHTKRLILDVGCGTGAFTHRLADMGFEVIGLDLSEQMLYLACKNRQGIDNRYFIRADVEQLPFCSETFDAVLCFSVHHHFLAYHQIASEVSRVTKPDGWLFICDPNGINPHIALLMHPSSPARYSSLSPNQKPIRPRVLQEQYMSYGMQLYSIQNGIIRL